MRSVRPLELGSSASLVLARALALVAVVSFVPACRSSDGGATSTGTGAAASASAAMTKLPCLVLTASAADGGEAGAATSLTVEGKLSEGKAETPGSTVLFYTVTLAPPRCVEGSTETLEEVRVFAKPALPLVAYVGKSVRVTGDLVPRTGGGPVVLRAATIAKK